MCKLRYDIFHIWLCLSTVGGRCCCVSTKLELSDFLSRQLIWVFETHLHNQNLEQSKHEQYCKKRLPIGLLCFPFMLSQTYKHTTCLKGRWASLVVWKSLADVQIYPSPKFHKKIVPMYFFQHFCHSTSIRRSTHVSVITLSLAGICLYQT